MESKLREVERATRGLASVRKKRADISTKVAAKSRSLRIYEDRQASEDQKTHKKIAEEQKRLIREREAHERRISGEIRSRVLLHDPAFAASQGEYDFFISHASEDKDDFVRELAEALSAKGAKVWYDELTLKVGDSLRRNIEHGLANSRFGVVVLSDFFFKKEWPNKELDGLVTLEVQGQTRILPIWHKISKDEVTRYSPPLADKIALNTSLQSLEDITSELMNLLK